jgi:hypothetical protein
LVALVNNPRSGQTVTLTLPDGLKFNRPTSPTQAVDAVGAYTQLSWLVDVGSSLLGTIEVTAKLDPGNVSERQTLSVQPPDVQLSLMPHGPAKAGKPFWVSAIVRNPRPGQSVTLTLPDGLTLVKGHEASLTVDAENARGYVQVNWPVIPGVRLAGKYAISARLLPDGVECRADVDIAPGDLTN